MSEKKVTHKLTIRQNDDHAVRISKLKLLTNCTQPPRDAARRALSWHESAGA